MMLISLHVLKDYGFLTQLAVACPVWEDAGRTLCNVYKDVCSCK